MINNKQGFSLIELQVSMIVAAILVLTIGAIATIGGQSYRKVQEEARVYNDIAYGFKLIQNRVHTAHVVSVENDQAGWVNSQRLVIDNEAFGLRQKDDATVEFVHLSNKDDLNSQEIILSIPKVTAENPELKFKILDPKTVRVTLNSGDINKIPFNLSTVIMKRVL